MHFYNYRILFQIKREYSQHTTRLLCILRKRGSLSMGRSDTASSPTQWKLKRENPSASYRGVLRPSSVRDAFGMRSGRVRDASKGLSSRVNQVVPFLSFFSCSLTIRQSHILQCPSEMVILCQQQYIIIQLKRIEHTQVDSDVILCKHTHFTSL